MNLKERSDKIFEEIVSFQEKFNLKSEIMIKVPFITKRELIEFYREIFIKNVKKLSIQVD